MQTALSSARGRSSRGSWSAGITAEVEEQADAEVAGGRLTEEGGDIIAGMMTTVDTKAAIIAAGSTPRGEGEGVEGGWRRRAGDGGHASTLAIVVAVSVVNIGRRRRGDPDSKKSPLTSIDASARLAASPKDTSYRFLVLSSFLLFRNAFA